MSSLHRQSSLSLGDKSKDERSFFKKTTDSVLRMCQTADFSIACVCVLTLTPALFVLIFAVPRAMVDDGITTIEEMMKVLMEAQASCNKHLASDLPPTDADGNYYKVYCKGEWDQLTCWPNSVPGSTVNVRCPEYIPDFDHAGKAQRHCHQDGTWAKSASSNQTWTDYSGCHYPEVDELVEAIKMGDPKTRSLIQLYTVGYSFSLVALVVAMVILAYFKRLHCTRNYIHMHLFASFILRAVVIFVKDRVLYTGAGILDIRTQDGQGSLDAIQHQLMEIPNEKQSYFIGCKLVMTLFHYFVATNYYWILVEALYLHSLIFVAFFSDKKYLWRFTLTGWGVPVLFVVPWVIVRATLDNTKCWDIAVSEFKWIYNGPIVVANVINFLLFLNIIRVLWYKMRERGAVGRMDNGRQYKKLAKSTLVLIPMFGVHAIVFIGMPDHIRSGIWWDIRMYFDLFFNSFQGFFVAIIYCFCNGEVQAEFKKAWQRFNLSAELQRGRRERSRSSVTMLTTFNSSASQARPSISGQTGGRSGNHRTNGVPLLNSHLNGDGRNHSQLVKSESTSSKTKADSERAELAHKPADGNKNDLNSQVNEDAPLISSPPIIRSQSSSLPKGSDVILPISEEVDLEEAFESAVELQLECPAGSFKLAVDEEDTCKEFPRSLNNDIRPIIDTSDSDDAERADDFDDVIGCDETKRLRHKRKQRTRRAASEDSGIASMSAYRWRTRDESLSTSQSEYCADSEGGISDDVRHSSDAELYFKKLQCDDVTVTFEEEIVDGKEKVNLLNTAYQTKV